MSQGDQLSGKDGQLYRHTEFYSCHRYVKLADQYPDKKPKAINIAMIGFIMMQNGDVIQKTWILLDTYSIDSMTNNLVYV